MHTDHCNARRQLAGIFFLHFGVMWCGFFTELVSRPAQHADGSIDYERWQGDPAPLSPCATQCERRAFLVAKRRNYVRRMLPHTIGIFPYSAAWSVIVVNFNDQVADLCEGLRDRMPEFVYAIVYGSVAIFTCFTFVQWR